MAPNAATPLHLFVFNETRPAVLARGAPTSSKRLHSAQVPARDQPPPIDARRQTPALFAVFDDEPPGATYAKLNVHVAPFESEL